LLNVFSRLRPTGPVAFKLVKKLFCFTTNKGVSLAKNKWEGFVIPSSLSLWAIHPFLGREASVTHFHFSCDIVRRVIILAGLGFALVVLSGPLIAILSIILSAAFVILIFAFLGFLAWGFFQAIVNGPHAAWKSVGEFPRLAGAGLRRIGGTFKRTLALPPQIGRRALDVVGNIIRGTWRITRSTTSIAVEIGLMTVTGFLVGEVVELAFGAHSHDPGLPIPFHALLGSLFGVLVGIAMVAMGKRSAKSQTSAGIS
jgi:hypothetical protein